MLFFSRVLLDVKNLSFSFGRNGNHAAVAIAAMEGNHAVNECVKRVVLTHTYVLSGIVNRTALANDDVAGYAGLSAPNLNA